MAVHSECSFVAKTIALVELFHCDDNSCRDHGKWEIPSGTTAYNINGVITFDGRYQM